ncbi:hypothetical protein V8J36_04970 [Frigidibacter sp. MR17.14]|uniref:hypothetical protein n=1 Tax=Frigidibacter sp. MR17.14 TaxID=3126509 RepID=UPI0030129FD1
MAGPAKGKDEDQRKWLRLFLLLPPVLCALVGYIAGEQLREPPRPPAGSAAEGDIFAQPRIVPLGRLALPLDAGLLGMTLTATVDVAMASDDTAYFTRRGANRTSIKDAMILALADAMQVPGIRAHLDDSTRLTEFLAQALRQRRVDVAGVRVSALKVVDAEGVAVQLAGIAPDS